MRWLRSYFQLDKRQERGFLVLIFIMIIVIAFNRYAPRLFSKSQESLLETRVFIEKLPYEVYKEPIKAIKKTEIENTILEINRFFDPNTISLEELKETKLPSYVAENWIKYRNSGAVFWNIKDVSKIYGMNEDLFEQLKPWIVIEKEEPKIESVLKKEKNEITFNKPAMPESIVLGINSADSVQFLNVNGIGPFYAGAIVRYRERLGGYKNIKQLKELYKMDSSKYEKMLAQLYLDTIEIRKLNINTADFKEILRHPYIDYETTKFIVNKRNRLGKFAAVYQLKDSVLMSDSLYHKILPYITLDD